MQLLVSLVGRVADLRLWGWHTDSMSDGSMSGRREGYLFVEGGAGIPAAGDVYVKQPFEPPCLVVDYSLADVLATKWPGRLLRVSVGEPTTAEESAATEALQHNFDRAQYARTYRVTILEELAPSLLFGRAGEHVAAVVAVAQSLTLTMADRLAAGISPDAAAEFDACWRRWLADQPDGTSYLAGNHESTLLIPGAGSAGSPVGHGLVLINSELNRRARMIDPGAIETVSVDGEFEEVLSDPWSNAQTTLRHAAMAYGAPQYTENSEVLTAAWRGAGHPAF
ncbi:hypothetical protein ACWFRB_18760 [Rhodococcus sp. NPDC055112]